jgi:hypothetical protein
VRASIFQLFFSFQHGRGDSGTISHAIPFHVFAITCHLLLISLLTYCCFLIGLLTCTKRQEVVTRGRK